MYRVVKREEQLWEMFVCFVICLPTEQRVLENSSKRVRAFQVELEFGIVGF